MEPRREYIMHLVRQRDWSGSELARQMGISRAEANRFLNGQRKGGKKLIAGLLKAFPDETLETLFILPTVEPNVNTIENNVTHKKTISRSRGHPLTKPSPAKSRMNPVKHPSAHRLACSIDETTGTVEIVDGKCITTLLVPVGPIEVRHTLKQVNRV